MHQTYKFLSGEQIGAVHINGAYEAHSNTSATQFKVLKLGVMPKVVHKTTTYFLNIFSSVILRNLEVRTSQIGEEICNYIIVFT